MSTNTCNYKLSIQFKIITILFCSNLLISLPAFSQTKSSNPYELILINNTQSYVESITEDSSLQMVDLKKLIPNLSFDLKYTTANNFTGTKLYPKIITSYLRRDAAIALLQIQKELDSLGLALKVWDGYRPYHITEKMWLIVPDERYAANPKFGSGHNRGIAIDLTLVNKNNLQEINMGTGFDNFSDTAHHNFSSLPNDVLKHRLLLRSIMEKYGFKALETEWWHYYFVSTKKYPLMDIDFTLLESFNK